MNMMKAKVFTLLPSLLSLSSHISMGLGSTISTSSFIIHNEQVKSSTAMLEAAPLVRSRSSNPTAFLRHHHHGPYSTPLTMTPPSKEEEEAEAARVEEELQHGTRQSALIIQNKGGGHGELGFQLAQHLLSAHPDKIDSVTILQDQSCDYGKEPFKSYMTDLPQDKVAIIEVDLSFDMLDYQLQAILGGRDASFDYVWDNNSKGVEKGCGKAICDCAKSWNCKLFAYISSAGIYQPTPTTTFPMDEQTTPIKDSSGQAQFESYATSIGLPFVSFRPQYIYGVKSNKWDYIDWFFDRLCHNKVLPIPGDGTQKVSLTNSKDVASLLASPLYDEETAIQQRYFNCGTDDLISYNDVANLCMDVAGIHDAKIHHYDASLGKAKFPFRLTDFYVAPDRAKEKLGWTGPRYTLERDLEWYYELYKSRRGGLEEKQIDFSADEGVLGG